MRLFGKSHRNASLTLVGVFLALVVAGIVYEKIGERRDRTRYARIGDPVNIGNRTLNLYCSGQGSPVVVFESGAHTAGYGWVSVQPEVAKFTRACWYDRAGFGWSDPGPAPRTYAAIAEDLHSLLQAAGVPGPYVMVGATAGAYHVRVYNGRHPEEVAGAVLVEASDTDLTEHVPPRLTGRLERQPGWVQQATCRIVKPALLHVGLLRLLNNPHDGWPFGMRFLPPEEQNELAFLSITPLGEMSEGAGCSMAQSMADVRASGTFGNRPLRVLASSHRFVSSEPDLAEDMEKLNRFWFGELQPRLAALSSRGRLEVSEDAEGPAAILAAIKAVVAEVRELPPSNPAASR
ncbi:MAG TPA: alpha/beta hydrolase [Acidobacteriaceae bacterium]|nr:alpha/beta hydrolase [Acidobacteriaceae bacterium]